MNALKKTTFFGLSVALAFVLDAAVLCGCRLCLGVPIVTLLAIMCMAALFCSGGSAIQDRFASSVK